MWGDYPYHRVSTVLNRAFAVACLGCAPARVLRVGGCWCRDALRQPRCTQRQPGLYGCLVADAATLYNLRTPYDARSRAGLHGRSWSEPCTPHPRWLREIPGGRSHRRPPEPLRDAHQAPQMAGVQGSPSASSLGELALSRSPPPALNLGARTHHDHPPPRGWRGTRTPYGCLVAVTGTLYANPPRGERPQDVPPQPPAAHRRCALYGRVVRLCEGLNLLWRTTTGRSTPYGAPPLCAPPVRGGTPPSNPAPPVPG